MKKPPPVPCGLNALREAFIRSQAAQCTEKIRFAVFSPYSSRSVGLRPAREPLKRPAKLSSGCAAISSGLITRRPEAVQVAVRVRLDHLVAVRQREHSFRLFSPAGDRRAVRSFPSAARCTEYSARPSSDAPRCRPPRLPCRPPRRRPAPCFSVAASVVFAVSSCIFSPQHIRGAPPKMDHLHQILAVIATDKT